MTAAKLQSGIKRCRRDIESKNSTKIRHFNAETEEVFTHLFIGVSPHMRMKIRRSIERFLTMNTYIWLNLNYFILLFTTNFTNFQITNRCMG